jgi:hypothetical protein
MGPGFESQRDHQVNVKPPSALRRRGFFYVKKITARGKKVYGILKLSTAGSEMPIKMRLNGVVWQAGSLREKEDAFLFKLS